MILAVAYDRTAVIAPVAAASDRALPKCEGWTSRSATIVNIPTAHARTIGFGIRPIHAIRTAEAAPVIADLSAEEQMASSYGWIPCRARGQR